MSRRNNIIILQHLFFWIFYLLLFRLVLGFGKNIGSVFWISVIGQLPFQIITVYGSVRVIKSSHRILQRSYKIFIIVLIIIALSIVSRLIVLSINHIPLNIQVLIFNGSYIAYVLLTAILTFGVISIELIFEREKFTKEKVILEKQKIEAELNALKNQLNAHFLFNTLNNLYGLSLQKSDKAPEGIMRLSELLSIVLYECKPEFYPLEKEIVLIENYIELQQLRYSKRLKIEIEKDIVDQGLRIAPMVLFSFVENSFKHGASNEIREPWIKLKLEAKNGEVRFELENSKVSVSKQIQKEESNGIGLTNCKQRLNLLYPQRHSLDIKNDTLSYKVNLNLKVKL